MKDVYVTGDHHFDHAGIIAIENRPFHSENHQKKSLIRFHNEVVTDFDTVYFLGDLFMGGRSHKSSIEQVVSQLNGQKHLILGNHDILDPLRDYVEMGFHTVHTCMWLSIKENVPHLYEEIENLHEGIDRVYMVHDPASSIISKDNLWLCAHVHSAFRKVKNIVNVGVDVRNYRPMLLEDAVREFMSGEEYIP